MKRPYSEKRFAAAIGLIEFEWQGSLGRPDRRIHAVIQSAGIKNTPIGRRVMLIALLLAAQSPPEPPPDPRIEPIVDYVLCVEIATQQYALQPEPAAVIADAVLGACEREEYQYRTVLFALLPRLTTEQVDGQICELREDTRRSVLSKIIEARIDRPR